MGARELEKAAKRFRKHQTRWNNRFMVMPGEAMIESLVLRWEMEQQAVAEKAAGLAASEIAQIINHTEYDVAKVDELAPADPPSEQQRETVRAMFGRGTRW